MKNKNIIYIIVILFFLFKKKKSETDTAKTSFAVKETIVKEDLIIDEIVKSSDSSSSSSACCSDSSFYDDGSIDNTIEENVNDVITNDNEVNDIIVNEPVDLIINDVLSDFDEAIKTINEISLEDEPIKTNVLEPTQDGIFSTDIFQVAGSDEILTVNNYY